MELLWSGWRAAYVQSGGAIGGVRPEDARPGGRSVFTRILASGLPDDETYIVHRGLLVFAILNLFPYAVGHILVLPYREIADLEDLTDDESLELWSTVRDAVSTLKLVYAPQGLNVGVNFGGPAGGSVAQHLHVHVVPRWTGDANFMTATANTRTLPEALPDTAARLRAAWVTSSRPRPAE